MDLSSTIIILAGVIIAVLGVGAGMLINSLNEEGEPEDITTGQTPPGGKKGRFTPVGRLWRENTSGNLVVEIDGKSFLGAAGLNDAQRERLESAARDLRTWLGMGRAGSQAGASPAAAPTVDAVVNPVPTANSANLDIQASAPVAATAPQVSGPGTTAVAAAATRAKPPVKEEPAPLAAGTKSIVMQIEDILQDMIAGTALEQRGIHLLEDPVRGVIVHVGMEQFAGIDAVTDPEAREAIRAAVKEWETSQ